MQNMGGRTMLRFGLSYSPNLSLLESAADAVPFDTPKGSPTEHLNVAGDFKFLCMVRSSQLVGSVG